MFHLHGRELNVGLSSMVVVPSSYDHHHIVAVQGDSQRNQHPRNHKHFSLFLTKQPTPTSQKSKGLASTVKDLDWSECSVAALSRVKLWSEWAGQRSLIELIDVDGDDLVFLYFSFSLFETFFHIIELICYWPCVHLFSSYKCLLCLLNIFENTRKVGISRFLILPSW